MDETALLSLAPSPDVFDAAGVLFRQGALAALRRTGDGSLLFGTCAGSGAVPYDVSADLRPATPSLWCSCPSRKRPCKHALALLVAHARQPAAFTVAEAPPELLEKRAKAEAKAVPKAARAGKKKAPNKEARAKKAQAQLEGLDVAQRVLDDLATLGLGSLDDERIAALRARATELADFHLPGVAICLRRLALAFEDAEADSSSKGAIGARRLGQLWAMIRKGRALLAAQLEGDAAAEGEGVAVVEELLGKVWLLDELRDRGFVRSKLTLVELAYARVDDEARYERIETSYLADAETGEILRDVSYVPSRRIGKDAPKRSYAGAIEVAEAGIYPGFLNRRIRWDEEAASERALGAQDCERVIAHALGVAEACAKLQGQLKDLLAPEDAVFLLRVAKAGRIGDLALIEDTAGARLAFATDPGSEAALRALELSGWPAGGRALLARLSVDAKHGGVVAHPMSVLTPEGALRLSL